MAEVVCPQCEHVCGDAVKFCPVCGFPVAEIASKTDDPLVGTTLPGGYVIIELVGVGGMGRVYRAEQKTLGRTVAVKIVHPHLLGDESASARFITEARAASRLNHPNSVGVIDFGKTPQGQLYLVMEFLRGRDLARVTYEDGYLSFTRIVDVMCQVLAALDEAHHLGIIHRDLKPENIVLEPTRSGGDFVKVVDFGLAKMRVDAAVTGITLPGLVCGTPDYMAPEQGRGDPIDARSDIYACGVILFQLLTGRLPFEAESPTQVVLMHLTAAPPNPRVIAPERDIPQALVDVTLKVLSKSAKDRYQSAEDLVAALRASVSLFEDIGPVEIEEETIDCGSCGAPVPVGQKFCGECGARVGILQPPPRHSTRPPRQVERAPSIPSPPPALPRLPLPFAGREDDMEWLEACRFELGTALSTARIVGDHGVGKTRLLAQFLEAAQSAGDVVIRSQPDPWAAEVGHYALRRAIVGLADLPASGGKSSDWTNSTPEARRGLEEIFGRGEHRDNPPAAWVSDSGELSVEGRRFMAAEALRWAIAKGHHRAQKHRVILAIEDLQAVDGASRNALYDVINEPPLVGMLILATHPPDFDPGWGGPARIVSGLPLNVAGALAKGADPPKSQISDKTVSPMYVEQLIRFNGEGGGDAPVRLGDIIAQRIERLPQHARRVLQALAVLGDETPNALLAEVLETAGSKSSSSLSWQPAVNGLEETLQTLQDAGMAICKGSFSATSHSLIRDVTLAMIPAGVRRELHSRAYYDKEGGTRNYSAEVLALHAFYSQSSFEALMMLESVANRATFRGDFRGAVMALRRALDVARKEMSRGEIDDPDRAVLIFSRKLGEALARAGNLSDANGVLREALDLAPRTGADRVQVLGTLAFVARERSRDAEAGKFLKDALDLAKASLLVDLVDSLEKARRDWKIS